MARVGWATKSKLRRSYRIDFPALQAEVDRLGLVLDVKLVIAHGAGRTQTTFGTHRLKRRGDRTFGGPVKRDHHQITLLRHASAAQASRSLHHELAHALQAETVEGFHEDYRRHGRSGAAYLANPYEVEAREAEAAHALRPLTIPVGNGEGVSASGR